MSLAVLPVSRVCRTCEQPKLLAEFYFYSPGRASWQCKDCHRTDQRKRARALWASDPEYRARHNAAGKALRRGNARVERPATVKGNEKPCKVCNVTKPMSEFPLRGSGTGYRLKTCTACYTEAENLKHRTRVRADPEFRAKQLLKARRSFFKSRYGVTLEEVEKTLVQQHGLCANRACGTAIHLGSLKDGGKRAVVDHCHRTGSFRALLCDRCNIVLGHVEQNKNVVLGLIEYAERHEVKDK
jgi:hypothetical protein